MNEIVWIQIFWSVCVLAAVVAAVLASRHRWARQVGRVAVGVLMLLGGALFNAVNLATGGDYAGFADSAHFDWVTTAWRAVVAPHQPVFIGLLVIYEAAVGVLILLGGRRTQLGYIGAIGFHLALWLFGWFVTIYALIIVPALVLLLLAERRAAMVTDPSAVSSAPDGRVDLASP
ncbi:MAG TPA: hypothetical protein VFP34_12985 [Microlunatus sp.]|nr:hypothetical protein [Microlunatus sp.]